MGSCIPLNMLLLCVIKSIKRKGMGRGLNEERGRRKWDGRIWREKTIEELGSVMERRIERETACSKEKRREER